MRPSRPTKNVCGSILIPPYASATGLSLSKRAIAGTLDHPEAVALNDVLDLMDRAFCSLDAKEGVSAFIAKRKPSFR